MKQPLSPLTPFVEGYVLPVDKPIGWTSSDVVRKVKVLLRRLGYRKIKIGHAGTLDPLASGVLLICIGRATKTIESLQAEQKEYLATFELGATTPSYDREHPIDRTFPYEHITEELVRQKIGEMIGEQMQLPPTFSAKMIDGKRAYKMARKGKEVNIKAKELVIDEIELVGMQLPVITVRVVCSKGTYIRALARDIGEALGSGAHLVGLRRTRVGDIRVESCEQVDRLIDRLEKEEIVLPEEFSGKK